MQNILGFVPTATLGDGRTEIGRWANAQVAIPIEQMGRGVLSLIGIITSLAETEGKCFLIEELENDLHPRALKKVLDLIIQSSKSNQFVISTHSPTVLNHLGGVEGTKVFSVSSSMTGLRPTSKYQLVPDDPSERLRIIQELGFELSDVNLADAWLLLEEATSETFIKKYFVKWFAPQLTGRLSTVSCNGVNDVEPRFIAFQRFMVFLHLSAPFNHRVWVAVDDDDAGRRVIRLMKEKFVNTMPESRFMNFSHDNFEKYYPPEFQSRVNEALAIEDQDTRKREKNLLRQSVEEWIKSDEVRAIECFAESASDVIELLRSIVSELE